MLLIMQIIGNKMYMGVFFVPLFSLIEDCLVYSEHSLTITELFGHQATDRYENLSILAKQSYKNAGYQSGDNKPPKTKVCNNYSTN